MHGETILCIAPRTWHSLWKCVQQIMSRVAQRNRVLYFEPGRNPDRDVMGEMWRKGPNLVRIRSEAVHENLVRIESPPVLPIMRQHLPPSLLRVTTPAVVRINAAVLVRHVRRTMSAFHVERPILWLHSPYHFPLVGKFREKLACYYNYDEFPEFVQNRRIKHLLREYDDELTRRVDVVFATSRAQLERRQAVNPSAYFSPNGVDFELFNRALAPDCSLPPDIAALPSPIIGFVGWLGYQIDTELLLRVAQAFPECSLALIGPDELPECEALGQLRALPNVFFLGRKNLDQLPSYLRAFDVALIPYVLEGHVLSIYPLKLHEYLAAGRAVVTVRLPELLPYRDVVHIAESSADFISQIGHALRDRSPAAIAARVAVARENTWEQRVEAIYDVLNEHLPDGTGHARRAA